MSPLNNFHRSFLINFLSSTNLHHCSHQNFGSSFNNYSFNLNFNQNHNQKFFHSPLPHYQFLKQFFQPTLVAINCLNRLEKSSFPYYRLFIKLLLVFNHILRLVYTHIKKSFLYQEIQLKIFTIINSPKINFYKSLYRRYIKLCTVLINFLGIYFF